MKISKFTTLNINNIKELKQGVLNGSIPSAVAHSGATSSVGTKRDKKECIRCNRKTVKQGLPHAQRRHRKGKQHRQITPRRTPSCKGCAHRTWNRMRLTNQHPKVRRRQLRRNFRQGRSQHLQCQQNNNPRIQRRNSPRLAMQKYEPMVNPPHQKSHQ